MRTWEIAILTTFLFLLANAADKDDDDNKLRSPQCVKELNRLQVDALHHFNGIFGSFKAYAEDDSVSGISGPIAAINITTQNYGINTLTQKSHCESFNPFLRYGLISRNAEVNGDIYGEAWAENGFVQSERGLCSDTSLRILEPKKDYLESLWAFAPPAIRNTSMKLAAYSPDTVIPSVNTGLVSTSSERSFPNFRIIKLPACSDRSCADVGEGETTSDVLKGSSDWFGNYGGTIPPSEMIVFNIPVYVDSTYTISTLDVTKNISPCQVVYNFYAVDQDGKQVDSEDTSFTIVRSPAVLVTGTVLAPQAKIIDSSTGYFGGQLITLQSYVGNGASIKDFGSISGGKCTSRSLCWPQGPKVVVEVVTVSNVDTQVSTVQATSTRDGTQTAQPKTVVQDGVYDINELAEMGMLYRLATDDNGASSVSESASSVEVQFTVETTQTLLTSTAYAHTSTSTIVDVVIETRPRPTQSQS